MGIFDWFQKSKTEKKDSPEELFKELQKAVVKRNETQFNKLLQSNLEVVKANFNNWRALPKSIANDQQALQLYAQTLVTIANVLQVTHGDSTAIDMLVGKEDDNILLYWQNRYDEANEMIRNHRFTEAIEKLQATINRLNNEKQAVNQPTITTLKSKTFGLLGISEFQNNNLKAAFQHFQDALSQSEKVNDQEGIQAYLSSLYEAYRYDGDQKNAMEIALRIAVAVKDRLPLVARRFEVLAEIHRRGEPRNRIVANIRNNTYEIDDLPSITELGEEGKVEFNFYRNRIVLSQSDFLTSKATKLFSTKKVAEALELYREAIKADLHNPQPHYELGYALLLNEEIADGLEESVLTEELAPGWYQCREQIWLAGEVLKGHLDPKIMGLLGILDDAAISTTEKIELAKNGLKMMPRQSSILLRLGIILKAVGSEAEAKKCLLEALESAVEPDVETRICIEIVALEKDQKKIESLLQRARHPEGNLLADAMARLLQKKYQQ